MTDPAAVERSVLALVAQTDRWIMDCDIAARLGLPEEAVLAALVALCASGEMDYVGIRPEPGICFHLPLREVRAGRRGEGGA